MAKIRRRSSKDGGGYQVRYYGPDRRRHAKTFQRKREAEQFAPTVEADKARGECTASLPRSRSAFSRAGGSSCNVRAPAIPRTASTIFSACNQSSLSMIKGRRNGRRCRYRDAVGNRKGLSERGFPQETRQTTEKDP